MAKLKVLSKLTVDQRIAALVADGEAWEAEYARSHKQLYQLLSRCLHFVNDIQPDTTEFDRYTTGRGLVFKKDTELANRVCSVVFGLTDKNRSRVSAYARVLKAAIKANKAPAELAAWLEDRGGVEAVRLNSATPKSPDSKSDTESKGPTKEQKAETIAQIPYRMALAEPIAMQYQRYGSLTGMYVCLVHFNEDRTAACYGLTNNADVLCSVVDLFTPTGALHAESRKKVA